MSRCGGHFLEDFLIKRKMPRPWAICLRAQISNLHSVWAQWVRKSGGYKIDVTRLGYNEQPCGHIFEEFLMETKGAKTTGNLPAGPNNYPAPSLGPIGEKKWRI